VTKTNKCYYKTKVREAIQRRKTKSISGIKDNYIFSQLIVGGS